MDLHCQNKGGVGVILSEFNTPKNIIKYYLGGTHLKCVNNHYAKFEHKGMKTVGVTDYINQMQSSILDGKML